MPPPVDESWDRILAWLNEHAPISAGRIGPPAEPEEISAAEEAAGVELPADLVAWWRRANGTTTRFSTEMVDLLPGYWPSTIEHALNDREILWKVWHDDMLDRGWLTEDHFARAHADPAGAHAGSWLSTWLPIMSSGGGQYLFVDLRSGPLHGCVREFDKVYTDGKPLWTSVAVMLADIAHALETNSVLKGGWPGRVHVEEDGRLGWDLTWDADE
jgi:cell wall assembly regulator SMI1